MLLGIDLFIWGSVCLAFAALYFFAWPRPRGGAPRPAWAAFVLRWFHSLVWVSLAVTCFIWNPVGARPAQAFAILAAVLYGVFVVTFFLHGGRARP